MNFNVLAIFNWSDITLSSYSIVFNLGQYFLSYGIFGHMNSASTLNSSSALQLLSRWLVIFFSATKVRTKYNYKSFLWFFSDRGRSIRCSISGRFARWNYFISCWVDFEADASGVHWQITKCEHEVFAYNWSGWNVVFR